jgi:hypothetical protein
MILADDVGEALRPQPVGQWVRRLLFEQGAHALFVTLVKAQGCPGKVEGWSFWKLAAEFAPKSPLPGLVPGTHVSPQPQCRQ